MFDNVSTFRERGQLQILGEPLTNLPAFVTSNIVKAFQKRLMPAFVPRIQLPSWIGTRFPRGSPESFERIEAWNNSKSFETQDSRRKKKKDLGNLVIGEKDVEESSSFRES